MNAMKKRRLAGGALAAALALTSPAAHAFSDPLEPLNRAMFAFNRAVLDYVVNPVVQNVGPSIPKSAQTGLYNMYSNLTEVEFLLNGLLRADLPAAATSVGRFAVNSTLGVAGVFDVATSMGMKRQTSDYGGSLCQTGLPPGPYLVLPLVGATNAVAAPLLVAGVALEVYALSFISTTLAMADFIIIDIGGSASALRYMNSIPPGGDGYVVQRAEYQTYIQRHCG
jgi:phospholipid-binding lipoprotein MlaA